MKRKDALIIEDSENAKNIFIKVNLKNNTTRVFSNFSSWENLAFIMEGLSVTAQKCIQEGMNKKQVYGAIKNYLMQVLGNYEIAKTSKKVK